jgi:serine-type D-Ala-D-Ala carboxypeptidase (penicillin-binding protein 5/6)
MTMDEQENTNKLPVAQQLLLLGVILVVIFAGTVTPKLIALLQKENAPAATSQTQNIPLDGQNTPSGTPFENISIRAKAAYVWDINNQKPLYKKEEAEQLPLASLTKLMTALVANEVLEDSQNVRIGDLSIRQDGDSGLVEGEVFDRLTLSDLVLMSSSNDGAFALAAAAGNILIPNSGANSFVNAMNIRAEEIGLKETYYKNPTGLDLSLTEGGAYGSARDMAFLMEYIVLNEPDILAFTREDQARVYSQTGEFHDAENTNYYVDEIPGLIGSKTGYTDLAGGNLVIAFNAGLNRPIAAVVLGSTQQERFTDMLKLVEETQRYVTNETQSN